MHTRSKKFLAGWEAEIRPQSRLWEGWDSVCRSKNIFAAWEAKIRPTSLLWEGWEGL